MTRTKLLMRDVLQFAGQGIVGGKRLVGRTLHFLGSKIADSQLSGAEKQKFATTLTLSGREDVLLGAFRFIRRNMLGGDYLEFGVYRGHTIHLAYGFSEYMAKSVQGWLRAAERAALMRRMRFFGFDSFEGLPEPVGIDAGPIFQKGDFATSLDEVRRRLRERGTDLSRVHLIPGFYDEVLTPSLRQTLALQAAAIVHVDCDFYKSTKTVLDFVTPLLQDGTIIIFDDWFHYCGHPHRGEQKAFSEWREQHPDWLVGEFMTSHDNKAFVMNRAE